MIGEGNLGRYRGTLDGEGCCGDKVLSSEVFVQTPDGDVEIVYKDSPEESKADDASGLPVEEQAVSTPDNSVGFGNPDLLTLLPTMPWRK